MSLVKVRLGVEFEDGGTVWAFAVNAQIRNAITMRI